MPSPRTEPERSGRGWRLDVARGVAGFFQQLNTRLVYAIATVALASLLVSSLAINQILPGYFEQQTREQLNAAGDATELLIVQNADEVRAGNPSNLLVAEIRDSVVRSALGLATDLVLPATYTAFNDRGQQVARAEPDNTDDLLREGLRPDSIVSVRRSTEIQLPSGGLAVYTLTIEQPYTSRETTVQQIQSALIGSGFLALVASVILGAVAARRLTRPISRLRRLAARVAQGDLDERAEASGVLEIDELGHQFNLMADQLAETLRMLEADRDRLREFVADVSHELRTPVAALRMYTELQRDGQVDEATRAEFLERSAEQIRRLEWMSTNLLDLSRIDAGIFPLDVREGDLRDPIRVVVEAQSEVAEQREISLASEVPAMPVELRFDRERIVQLLTNLVGNALKFTPPGGDVRISLTEDADAATIEVRDTGLGIPAEELPRIFERFYRGTNTGDARASGSGLGLAIVRSIVDMHGGAIDVASVTGEGTVFRIRLPRSGVSIGEGEPAASVSELEG
jgi:signal transduction histidine kinase